MQKIKSGLVALTVGIVLLSALDWAASAATGRAFVLGRWNQADHTTTLKNTDGGAALALKGKGANLQVSNSKRIKKLNADQLDGLSGADYKTNRNSIYQWSVAQHTGGFTQAIPAQRPETCASPRPPGLRLCLRPCWPENQSSYDRRSFSSISCR